MLQECCTASMNGFTLLRSNVSFPRFPDFYYGNALKLRMMSLRGKWIASNETLCQKFSLGLQIQQVNPKFLKPHLSKLLQHLVAVFYNPPVYLCVPVLTYHKEPTGLYAPVFSPAHGYINCCAGKLLSSQIRGFIHFSSQQKVN